MKKIALLSLTLLAGGGLALATTVNCTVITGGVVTASLDVAKIFAGESGGSLGVFNCPGINPGGGLIINNLRLLATGDYDDGPFGTTSGTTVTQVFDVATGPFSPASQTILISGGNSSTTTIPAVPFQIGSTLNGLTSTSSFIVNLSSHVTAGGGVAESSGQVVLSYTTASATPEPATYGTMAAALIGVSLIGRRRKKS